MPGVLEIDCEHHPGSDWEEPGEILMGIRPWLHEIAIHWMPEDIRVRSSRSILEWLEHTTMLTHTVGTQPFVEETIFIEPVSLQERFEQQANKWRRETEHMSSPTQMMTHPSYQAILGMAQENKNLIIRLLLRDLQANRRPWFWALSYLTQDNPIKQADAGKTDKMIKAWVNWGKERNLL